MNEIRKQHFPPINDYYRIENRKLIRICTLKILLSYTKQTEATRCTHSNQKVIN